MVSSLGHDILRKIGESPKENNQNDKKFRKHDLWERLKALALFILRKKSEGGGNIYINVKRKMINCSSSTVG